MESDCDRRFLRRVVIVNQLDARSWYYFKIAAAACIMLLQGCTQSELRGTYDVEIEIAGAAAPIEGTLILSTGILDVPSLTEEDRAIAGDWFQSDTIDANSCFVFHGGSDAGQSPQSVRVFDARIRANDVVLPIEIFRTPAQRIEIVRLQFFADTIGGDVVLDDRGQQRVGRIHGIRSGSATPQRCLDDLELFRTNLRNSLPQ
jgi:hypothetical protein